MKKTLRILDLGCHDGYVGLWLARRLAEQNVSVDLDGIELHEDFARIAGERIAGEGFEGTVHCGDVMDAALYCTPGSYDAVVLYELLEHAPDPAKLLEVAERMAKPTGRVYVSTPDGTFGAGGNPHHLHAWRAQDLADMLRRRGLLQDMTVGGDGVTVAAYIPARRRGEIAIFTGGCWQTWSPRDIESKGLGGSETAAVRLAETLSELGWVVTVYGEVEQCCYRDVIFRHHTTFDPTERREVVISSRIPELFDRPINARVRMLWAHDVDFGDRLTQRRAAPIDHILTLSCWHEQHLKGAYPFAREAIRRTRNGIHLEYFAGELDEPRAQRLIYTSSPDRGLDVLLELWPRIKAKVPDAVLSYCYSDVYDAVAAQDPTIGAFRDRILELREQPGVQPLGSLNQRDLARLMRTSMVWAHPSWASPYAGPFHETSCIGAMEAQAAGCLVVASDWGALSETVAVGRKIGTPPLSKRWRDAFVREIVDGLTSPKTQKWAQAEGPKAAAELGWEGVAEQITGLVDGTVEAYAGAKA